MEKSTKNTYLDPMISLGEYYNNLVLQQIDTGFNLEQGAKIYHLSVGVPSLS